MRHRPQPYRAGRLILLGILPFVAGAVVAIFRSRNRRIKTRAYPFVHSQSIQQVCRYLMGHTKASVARAFGLPRASAGFTSLAPALLLASDRPLGDVWYYPLDSSDRTALAVRFSNNIARSVQVVASPRYRTEVHNTV